MRKSVLIRLVVNGEAHALAVPPQRTLLEALRYDLGLTGSKQGCDKGDCGACTVALTQINPQGSLECLPVNACILCLGTLDGKELTTVEGLKNHPVQQAIRAWVEPPEHVRARARVLADRVEALLVLATLPLLVGLFGVYDSLLDVFG